MSIGTLSPFDTVIVGLVAWKRRRDLVSVVASEGDRDTKEDNRVMVLNVVEGDISQGVLF